MYSANSRTLGTVSTKTNVNLNTSKKSVKETVTEKYANKDIQGHASSLLSVKDKTHVNMSTMQPQMRQV